LSEMMEARILAARTAYDDAIVSIKARALSGRKMDRDGLIAEIERKRDGLIKLLREIDQ